MCPAGIFQLAGSCMCRADSVSVRPQVVDQDPVPVCGTLSGSSSPMIAPRVAAPSSSPFQPTPTPPIALRSAPRIKPAPRVRNKSPQNHSGTHQDVPFPRECAIAYTVPGFSVAPPPRCGSACSKSIPNELQVEMRLIPGSFSHALYL